MSNGVCIIDGCTDEILVKSRQWCSKHYTSWRKWGDPLEACHRWGAGVQWLREAIATRDRSQCWDWPYGRKSDGYGTVRYEGVAMAAHVLALILDGKPRPDPPGDEALHGCDRPICCNPAHVRWGTYLENLLDMTSRGRQVNGERCGRTKLTEADVVKIRKDTRLRRIIGAEYGVSYVTIGEIQRGRAWKHVPWT